VQVVVIQVAGGYPQYKFQFTFGVHMGVCSKMTPGQSVAAAVRNPEEHYTITIDKSERRTVGVKFDKNNLQVLNIDHGLVANWNKEHADEEVKVGDTLISVNGVTGDIRKTMEEFRGFRVHTAVLRKGPHHSKCQERAQIGFDVRRSVDSSKPIIIGYHGGCPDGCGAAHMMVTALRICYPSAVIECHPIGHGMQSFTSIVKPGAVVFSLDISPTLEDIDALKTASSLIIVDHHASEADTQQKLQEAIPTIVNLSDLGGKECGASLVAKMVQDVVTFEPKIVTMLHKMDVFAHTLPDELKTDYDFFRSFMIQNGERNVTIGLVTQMFANYEESLRRGREMFDAILARTDALALSAECVIDDADFRMYLVEQPAGCGPIDFPRYQQKIDELRSDIPTLFVTRTLTPLPTGMYNLGLRRAGSGVDISKVAAGLKSTPPFVSGGGHPYAGGAQSPTLVTRQEVIDLVGAAACSTLSFDVRRSVDSLPRLPARRVTCACHRDGWELLLSEEEGLRPALTCAECF
jgi:hypothetical protein